MLRNMEDIMTPEAWKQISEKRIALDLARKNLLQKRQAFSQRRVPKSEYVEASENEIQAHKEYSEILGKYMQRP